MDESIIGGMILMIFIVCSAIMILRELSGYNRIWRARQDIKWEMWKLKRAEKKRLKELAELEEEDEDPVDISVRIKITMDDGRVVYYDTEELQEKRIHQ